MIQVPEDAVKITSNTVTIRVENVHARDESTFYDPLPPSTNIPSVASFEMTYTRTGAPHLVQPTSADPASPFNWAGTVWTATGSVRFSVAYADGSFSAQGSATSSGTAPEFGEIVLERNGSFLQDDQGQDENANKNQK